MREIQQRSAFLSGGGGGVINSGATGTASIMGTDFCRRFESGLLSVKGFIVVVCSLSLMRNRIEAGMESEPTLVGLMLLGLAKRSSSRYADASLP